MLDLGGGYSGNLTEGITMAAVAASLNAALDEHFPPSSGVRIIAEPGRYYAEPGMTLFTRVYGKRVRESHRPNDTHYYWISDGAYGSMNCLLYDHAVLHTAHFPTTGEPPKPPATNKSTVYGPTCDCMDTLLRGVELPDLELARAAPAHALVKSREIC